ncbi:MAG TPA: glutathione S-transferase [Ramlibacter sp.]|jgi:glutathione S-transferase
MFTFYYARNSCALATHLALEHAGAPYTPARIDFGSEQQRSPEFLRINPKGRVPALDTGRGIITETPALLHFVAQSFPQSGLAPLDDALLLARVNEFNSYLCSTVHVAHAHRGRGYRWADDVAAIDAMKRKVAQNMADCFALIEERMLQGPWVLGERFSSSDFYLFTVTRWLEGDGVDVNRFPKVAQHLERMNALPVVRKVLADWAA